jgi:hypothetical protein
MVRPLFFFFAVKVEFGYQVATSGAVQGLPLPLRAGSVMTSCAVGSGLPPDFKALAVTRTQFRNSRLSSLEIWHSAIVCTQADSKHTDTV